MHCRLLYSWRLRWRGGFRRTGLGHLSGRVRPSRASTDSVLARPGGWCPMTARLAVRPQEAVARAGLTRGLIADARILARWSLLCHATDLCRLS